MGKGIRVVLKRLASKGYRKHNNPLMEYMQYHGAIAPINTWCTSVMQKA